MIEKRWREFYSEKDEKKGLPSSRHMRPFYAHFAETLNLIIHISVVFHHFMAKFASSKNVFSFSLFADEHFSSKKHKRVWSLFKKVKRINFNHGFHYFPVFYVNKGYYLFNFPNEWSLQNSPKPKIFSEFFVMWKIMNNITRKKDKGKTKKEKKSTIWTNSKKRHFNFHFFIHLFLEHFIRQNIKPSDLIIRSQK